MSDQPWYEWLVTYQPNADSPLEQVVMGGVSIPHVYDEVVDECGAPVPLNCIIHSIVRLPPTA